jgi:hypothetical protein
MKMDPPTMAGYVVMLGQREDSVIAVSTDLCVCVCVCLCVCVYIHVLVYVCRTCMS